MKQKRIFLGNAFNPRCYIEVWDETVDGGAGGYVPFAGSVVQLRLSATPSGLAIDPAVQFNLMETGAPGIFIGAISSAIVDAHLTAYKGKPVYQIVKGGPADELLFVTTRLVTAPRYA